MGAKGKTRKKDAPDKYLPIADGISCRFDSDSDEIRCKIGNVTRRTRIGDMSVLDEPDPDNTPIVDETSDGDANIDQSQDNDEPKDNVGADNCNGKACKTKSSKRKKKSSFSTQLEDCLEKALRGE